MLWPEESLVSFLDESIPEQLNITAYLADRQVALGHGSYVAYITDYGPTT
jgi:hypothetical protein